MYPKVPRRRAGRRQGLAACVAGVGFVARVHPKVRRYGARQCAGLSARCALMNAGPFRSRLRLIVAFKYFSGSLQGPVPIPCHPRFPSSLLRSLSSRDLTPGRRTCLGINGHRGVVCVYKAVFVFLASKRPRMFLVSLSVICDHEQDLTFLMFTLGLGLAARETTLTERSHRGSCAKIGGASAAMTVGVSLYISNLFLPSTHPTLCRAPSELDTERLLA